MLKLGKKLPKQERSKSTVDAILEAVTRIMEKDGEANLTTNKIAEIAGVSVGSLYQYFKNKESIFEAILLRMTERNLIVFEEQLKQIPENVNIRHIIKVIVQSHFENIQKMGKLSTTLLEYAPQVLSVDHFKKADEKIIQFLMIKTKEFNVELRPKNIEKAFFLCSQTVRSVLFMTTLAQPKDEQQATIDELIDMLSTYLEKPGQVL